MLDRVLRRQDEERFRQLARLASERHLPLLHRFEQRRLHLRGRAVDLIGQHEVAEDRSFANGPIARLRLEELRADQIGRQQVGRELDAPERAAERRGERLRRQRFGLSHRFAQNGMADDYRDRIWSPFLERLDHDIVGMWQRGEWPDFCDMLPEYAAKGHGEGFMHDTAMLLGTLGWNHYDRGVEVVSPYFPSSGTGQINAVFPVSPMPADLTGIGEPRSAALAGGRL